jgi:hypothetical protein
MVRRDLRWMQDGMYLILTRPRSLGEIPQVIAYSVSYGRIWRYWMFNPDDLPENDGWMLAQRRSGYTVVIQRPIPPDRLKRLSSA